MKYKPQQIEFLKRFAQTDDARAWREILECAIMEIKDDCVLGDLSKDGAKAAVEKLEALLNRLTLLAEGKNPDEKVRFD